MQNLDHIQIGNDWDKILKNEFKKEYFFKLVEFLKEEYSNATIYPKIDDIFQAFELTSYSNTKIVIVGQDPYHGENQAHGLSFSVKTEKLPPSLKNIYKAINQDIGLPIPTSGDLTPWAKQGVLMINSVLTVRKSTPNSHKNKGWERFTDNVILSLNEKQNPVVFMLWGNYAKSKTSLITNPNHLILESVHPSPFSARKGFFECKHFSKANLFLEEHDLKSIDWRIKK